MKVYQSDQKLLVGHARAHTHTQTGGLINLHSFLESTVIITLKMIKDGNLSWERHWLPHSGGFEFDAGEICMWIFLLID
jgi:hypothetical protein